MSETGVSWDLVGCSVKGNKTVESIERIFKAAKQNGFEVFISPHYYYPTDYGWDLQQWVQHGALIRRNSEGLFGGNDRHEGRVICGDDFPSGCCC